MSPDGGASGEIAAEQSVTRTTVLMWRAWAATGAFILGLTALFPIWTNDLFGHLAAGRQIAELGYVPTHDTFSYYFDEPQPWRNHNWASCLLLYLVHQVGGFDALVWLKVLACAALGALVVLSCERRAFAAPSSVLLLVAGALSMRSRFTARPHLFGLLACALLLFALLQLARSNRDRVPWKHFAALGVLQIAWVNLHGSAPMAFLLTGAFAVGHYDDSHRRSWFLGLLGLEVVASCITPFGPSVLLETLYHVSSEETRSFIGEWGPLTSSDNAWDMPTWLLLAVLTLWGAKLVWQSGPVGRSWLLVTCGTLIMAYRSMRFVAEPLLLGAPCIATGVAMRLERVPSWKVYATSAALAAPLLFSIAQAAPHLPPYQPIALGYSPRNVPVEPGRWLSAHRPNARSHCAMEDCWYISFAVPNGKVGIDGRQAVYPLWVLKNVAHATLDPDHMTRFLARRNADAVILRHNRPEHGRTIAMLLQRPDFGLATIGDRHVLFVRGLQGNDAISVLWPNMALRAFTPEETARAKLEMERIGSHPGSSAYVGVQRALLALSPYLRAGGQNGLKAIVDEAQRARYRQALRELAPALVPNDNFPSAHALAAMLRLSLCDLDAAAAALTLAASEGENRHTLALRVELEIRRGNLDQAQATLAGLEHQSGNDAWLQILRDAHRIAASGHALCPRAK